MVTRTLCAHLSVLPAAFLATPPAGEGGPQGESTLYRCSLNEFIGGDELQVLLFHHLNLPASIRFLSCFFHLFFFFCCWIARVSYIFRILTSYQIYGLQISFPHLLDCLFVLLLFFSAASNMHQIALPFLMICKTVTI